jgi:hypothetical protein
VVARAQIELRDRTGNVKPGLEVVAVALVNRVHYEKGTRKRVSNDRLNNAYFHLNIDCLAQAGLFFPGMN